MMKRQNGKRLLSLYICTRHGIELCTATTFKTLSRKVSDCPNSITHVGARRQGSRAASGSTSPSLDIWRYSAGIRSSHPRVGANRTLNGRDGSFESTKKFRQKELLFNCIGPRCRGGAQLEIDENSVKSRKSTTDLDDIDIQESSEYDESEEDDEEEEEELSDNYESYAEEEDDSLEVEEYDEEDDSLVRGMTDKELQENLQMKSTKSSDVDAPEMQYDTPLFMSPMYGIIVQLGVMSLSRRLNMDDPHVIRAARISFIAFNIVMQLFALYVRIRAKQINDRTPLTINEGIGNLIKNTVLAGDQSSGSTNTNGGGNDMVKYFANQFLSSQTTIMEYDVRQSDKMRKSYIFSLILMWILHFKFKQVQPLFLTVASGLLQWIQSPLFQIYVLGRNLQRPFGRAIPENAAKDIATEGNETEETSNALAAEKNIE